MVLQPLPNWNSSSKDTLPETNSMKIDGWKTMLFFLEKGPRLRGELLVSGVTFFLGGVGGVGGEGSMIINH